MVQLSKVLQEVRVIPKKIDDYEPIVGKEKIDRLKELAKPLKGKKILNLNTTAYGGGVAELLKTQVALMQDLGLQVDWYVMTPVPGFFDVTKIFHNNMQGHSGTVSDEQKQIYLNASEINAGGIVENYDFVMAHDPQPLAMIDYVTARTGKWIWRCHIDTSQPNPDTWNFLYPYMQNYDAVVFTLDEFVKEGSEFNNLTFIPPSIDPLSPKNSDMAEEEVQNLMVSYNVDPTRPLLVQISRFDPWKDPLGVIDVYRNIKYSHSVKGIRGAQLVLVTSMAHDDPEGWIIYDRVVRRAGEDFDLHVYTNYHNVGDVGVKAFQLAADVVLQKSLKEGFGLTVAEALWKGKPVIGGNVGGIKLQIKDGVNGFLVSSIQEATEKTLYLMKNPDVAKKMGETGKEIVREDFLCIREIEDHLKLFNKLADEPCTSISC